MIHLSPYLILSSSPVHMAEWKILCLQTIIYKLIYATRAQIMHPELHMTHIHQS